MLPQILKLCPGSVELLLDCNKPFCDRFDRFRCVFTDFGQMRGADLELLDLTKYQLCCGLTFDSSSSNACIKEPSPIASSQLMPLSRSSLPSSFSQAARKRPSSDHSRSRRQQVEGLGCRSGPSYVGTGAFQRAPLMRTQMIPSRQGRGATRGRPPRGDGGGSASRSAIRSHWESERKGLGAVLDPVRLGRRRGGHSARGDEHVSDLLHSRGMQLACQRIQ